MTDQIKDEVKQNPVMVTMGRLVRYRMTFGEGERVAIVTKVHSQECINLFILMDASDDQSHGDVAILRENVMFGNGENRWRWPVMNQ